MLELCQWQNRQRNYIKAADLASYLVNQTCMPSMDLCSQICLLRIMLLLLWQMRCELLIILHGQYMDKK